MATNPTHVTYVDYSTPTIAAQWLNGVDTVVNANFTVTNVAALRQVAKTNYYTTIQTQGYYSANDGGAGKYVYNPTDTTSADNGGTIIVAADGGRWYLITEGGRVNVLQFGAIPNNTTSTTVAQTNREAFRQACVSYDNVWSALQAAGGPSRSVYVPPGQWNLSNGFTVPPGVSIYGDGPGTSITIFGATADTTNVIPLVSLGRVINHITLATQVTTGIFVVNPAPNIDGLWINPQNNNTAIDVTGVPGFYIGAVWLAAAIGLNIAGGSSDGMIDRVLTDSGTLVAVQFGACQAIQINQLHTFSANYGINFTAEVVNGYSANSIDITSYEANFNQYGDILTQPGAVIGRVRIDNFSSNNNAQYGTFGGCLIPQESACDFSFGNFDARNYNGYWLNENAGVGHHIHIERLFLRQAPNNPTFTTGTNALGAFMDGGSLIINYVDAAGLNGPLINMVGANALFLFIKSGIIGSLGSATAVINLSNSNNGSQATLENINNGSLLPMFAAQNLTQVRWRNIQNAFPVQSSGGRQAVFIPFTGDTSLHQVTIMANTNPGGDSRYRRVQTALVGTETGFTTGIVTQGTYSAIFNNTGLTTPPTISPQIDINSVGAGQTVSYVSFGYVVISVPSTYGNVSIDVQQIAQEF